MIRKLTEEQVLEIKKELHKGTAITALSIEYEVTYDNIRQIRLGQIWKRVPFPEGYTPRHLTGVKLNKDKVLEIRELLKTKTERELAETYGVHYATICDVRRRKTWRNV